MIIEIKNKKHTLKVGNRGLHLLQNNVDSKELKQGKVPYDVILDICLASIVDIGALKRKDVDDWLNDTPGATINIINEIIAFSNLSEEAKK